MFLKTIEIRGFKSFADKTEVLFKNGITSIVGPNGSGKSNVSDAVRWVLGEQSVKSLRGGKMEDVIFAGTQFRKALGVCHVALTLDNSDKKLQIDYSDVTISRRLYRSGESEYFINNTNCRLKDIQELFMDTGIGKEGYSIIGQGKIEAVLSGRPDERRSLIEEAAGIVKFKTRKEEAEKKLYNTDQNLIRLNDIISTFHDRLEPLRIESEKANEFIKLSEDLNGKEINIIVYYIDSLNSKIEILKKDMRSISDECIKLKVEEENLKAELDKGQKYQEEFESNIEKKKNVFYELKNLCQNSESEISLAKEKIENLKGIIERNLQEVEVLQSKVAVLNTNKLNEEENFKKYVEEQRTLTSGVIEKEDEAFNLSKVIASDEKTIQELKDNTLEFLTYSTSLANSVNNIKNELENLKNKIIQIRASMDSFTNSIKINQSTKELLQTENSIKGEVIKKHQEVIANNKVRINKLSNIEVNNVKNLRELDNNFNRFSANQNMLINLDKQYEGYNRAVKTLMTDIDKNKIQGIKSKCYVLGEILDVHKEYELGIETALGGAISDVITENEDTAKNLINYLKQNKIGRATFLPLTIIKGKKLNIANEIKSINGYIGIASELISFDEKFLNAIEYVLGKTVISKDMDSALLIAKKSNYMTRIVTLTGDVINPGGSLTGGSTPHKNTSIISRKREIEELGIKVEEIKTQISNLNDIILKDKATIKALDDECLNLKDLIYNENIEITRTENKIGNIEEENAKLISNLNISSKEIEMLTGKLKSSEESLVKNQNILDNRAKEESDNLVNIKNIESELKNKVKNLEVTRESITELKIKKAKIDEIVSNLVKELERYEREIVEINLREDKYKQEIEKSNISMNEEVLKKQSNSQNINDLKEKIADLELEFKKLEIERIEIKNNLKEFSSKLQSVSENCFIKENEKHKQDINLTKLQTEIEAYYFKLNNEIGITYAEGIEYRHEIDNLDNYKKNIDSLKSSITSLGNVNVGAVVEYDEVKEKYNFMSIQREDLIKATLELKNVISEMTNNMKKVFNENFAKLRENFNDTFRELFKGGNADLVLSDGDELNGNIEITVQPPGKKLQNINLMSGGEKGLSAIALLFAILKMKPTPFCILDEIEAALDDANVFRYAEFLRKFADSTQFIVITHRKGTMEASDALYGVTMEEKGVSKIVSVEFAKN